MSNIMILDWIANTKESNGNTAVKKQLANILLNKLFTYFEHEGNKKLSDTLSLYYNPDEVKPWLYYIDIKNKNSSFKGELREAYSYNITYDNINIIIIPDIHRQDEFLLAVCNKSPNDGYRSYIHCKKKGINIEYKSIQDFEGHLDQSQIIYSSDENVYHQTWGFDNRNYIYERLMNGLLVIYIQHRDSYFSGSNTLLCHDIESNKRWMYKSLSPITYEPSFGLITDKCTSGRSISFNDNIIILDMPDIPTRHNI